MTDVTGTGPTFNRETSGNYDGRKHPKLHERVRFLLFICRQELVQVMKEKKIRQSGTVDSAGKILLREDNALNMEISKTPWSRAV